MRRRKIGVAGICATALLAGCASAALSSGDASDTTTVSTPCGLALSYAGPTAAASFAGLTEDAAACAASSWREMFVEEDPPQGSLFVSTQCAQEGDGSLHAPYCTLTTALQNVASHQSADQDDTSVTIFVDPGEYTLAETVTAASIRAAITGLCSTGTIVQAASSSAALLTLNSAQGALKIESVTLSGTTTTMLAVQQGTLTLENVRVEISGTNNCMEVDSSAASLVLQYVELDGNVAAIPTITSSEESSPGSMSALMPLVFDDVPVCIHVTNGASAALENFTVHDFEGVAVLVEEAGSNATISHGVLATITPQNSDGEFGYGLAVQLGAAVTVDALTVDTAYGVGVLAFGADTTLAMADTYVDDVRANSISNSGVGVLVEQEAVAIMTRSTIANSAGPGLYVSNSATVTGNELMLDHNAFNAAVTDATLTLTGSTLSDAQSNASFSGQIGMFIQNLTDENPVTVTLTGNSIRDNPYGGLYLNAGGSASYAVTVADNDFIDNGGNNGFTASVAILDLPAGPTITRNCFQGLGDHAVVLHNADALLSGNTYRGNYDTFVVQHQACTAYTPVSPYQNPVDLSTETVTSGAPHCLCGVRSDTGAECSSFLIGPELTHSFGISEVDIL